MSVCKLLLLCRSCALHEARHRPNRICSRSQLLLDRGALIVSRSQQYDQGHAVAEQTQRLTLLHLSKSPPRQDSVRTLQPTRPVSPTAMPLQKIGPFDSYRRCKWQPATSSTIMRPRKRVATDAWAQQLLSTTSSPRCLAAGKSQPFYRQAQQFRISDVLHHLGLQLTFAKCLTGP